MKSKLARAIIVGLGLAVVSSGVAAADTGGGQSSVDDVVSYVNREPNPLIRTIDPLDYPVMDLGEEYPAEVLEKQREIDRYLFKDHADEIAQQGFMVTHTAPQADYVEIGITPFSAQNADYLYDLFGQDMVKVVEGRQAYLLPAPVPEPVAPAVEVDSTARQAVNVRVDGQPTDFADGNPYLDRDTSRVYVPLRYVSEALGADVEWKPETRAAVMELEDRNIEMPADQTVPLVDGTPGTELDAPARLDDGRLMVPLRFVSETLGYAVAWNGAENTVQIETRAGDAQESGITVTSRKVESTTDEIQVSLDIPVISGLSDKALEEEINAEFVQKAEDFRSEIEGTLDEYREQREEIGAPVFPYEVVTEYDVHYNQDGLLSISVSYYGFQGGAHGFTVKETLNLNVNTVNLNVNTGERLGISDFFGPDNLRVVRQQIQERIAAEPGNYFPDARDTVAQITEEQPFYIKDGHIVVYFGQYEIAPYAAGMPEFVIPVSVMPGETDEAAVEKLVEDFGGKLQLVSLLAPKDIVSESLQENYNDYVSPALLAAWQADPENAPGRMVSSPWPDRIEVLNIEELSAEAYEVQGEIVEITSTDDIEAGEGSRRPITLVVKKTGDEWLIDAVTLGEYQDAEGITYRNDEYGFTFSLPESWEGYEIADDQWEGSALESGREDETGPMILIRHPEWSSEDPRQDIPIMVFTLEQWEALQQREFGVGAAPVPPRELDRNSDYVFALPARYNFAFPTGFEEVEDILEGNPLQAS